MVNMYILPKYHFINMVTFPTKSCNYYNNESTEVQTLGTLYTTMKNVFCLDLRAQRAAMVHVVQFNCARVHVPGRPIDGDRSVLILRAGRAATLYHVVVIIIMVLHNQ